MNFNDIVTYENLRNSYLECKKGKMWKDSVISFDAKSAEELLQMSEELMNGTYKFSRFYETKINERGKERLIRSQNIRDRIVHKCLNNLVIKPTFEKSYIYDNSASIKGKGVDFSLRRLKCHLNRAYRLWGKDFYVLQIDIKKYFDSINHAYINRLFNKIEDEQSRKICKEILESYGDKGIGLGSEICQSIALMTLNEMDHKIKEELKIKFYGRYMDDAYLIFSDKEYLKKCLNIINTHLTEIGLELNKKKTQLYPIKNGIKYLGFSHRLTETGHIICSANYDKTVRARKKMKKLKKKIDNQEVTYKDAYVYYKSVSAHIKKGGLYHQAAKLGDYYNKTFIYDGGK